MKKLKSLALPFTFSLFLLLFGCSKESDELQTEPTSLEVEIGEFDGSTLKGGNKPSVIGHGTKLELTPLPDGTFERSQERFVFNAITRKDGKVEGNAIFNRPEGKVQIDINCVRYTGIIVSQSGREYKQMVLSGVVTRSDIPFIGKNKTATWIILDGEDFNYVALPSDFSFASIPVDCNSRIAMTVRLVQNGDIRINVDAEE